MNMKRQDFYELLDAWDNIYLLMNYLVDNPKHIDLLFEIGFEDKEPKSWRAIWLADKIHEKNPELIEPYIPWMIESLKTTKNESKIRHLLKLVSINQLPEHELSFLLDYCIENFTNADIPVAIRVHAMQTLYGISEMEPDFKTELIQIIEHEIEFHPTAGIKNRRKKLLKKLYSQTE